MPEEMQNDVTNNHEPVNLPDTPKIMVEVPRKSPWIIILLLFLVASLTLSGYFYWQNTLLCSTEPMTLSPSPTPTASADPTDNWKTYTNSVHNISFKYPVDWELKIEDDQAALNASLKLVKDQATIHMVFGVDGIGGQGRDYEGTPINLDGNEVFRYKFHNSYDNSETVGITDSLKESLGVLMINKKTYILSLNYPIKYVSSGESANLNQTFDQILSTFQFIKPATQGSIEKYYQITNYAGNKNLSLILPDDAIVSKNFITFDKNTYSINLKVGPGLCPMNPVDEACTYTDSTTPIWKTLRIWTQNGNTFAINPQTGTFQDVNGDGFIVQKHSPDTPFSSTEVIAWGKIIDNLIVK